MRPPATLLSFATQHEIGQLDAVLAIDCITDIKTLCRLEEFEKMSVLIRVVGLDRVC